jgi:gp16 family phage-associated protein
MKTPEQVKAEFQAQGLTISQWAREHNWTPREVSLVLNGQVKGLYGKGHEIAVALGIKDAPESDPEPELAAA